MSHISRIPRGRANSKYAKVETIGKENHDVGVKVQEVPSGSGHQISSSHLEVRRPMEKNSNSVMTSSKLKNRSEVKQPSGDRRGISQIKRSELALIKKVEQLERKLCSLDLELTASNKNVELHKENLNELQHDVEESKERATAAGRKNIRLCEMLEKLNVDPVDFNRMQIDESEMDDCTKRGESIAQELMSTLSQMDELSLHTSNMLNTMVFEGP